MCGRKKYVIINLGQCFFFLFNKKGSDGFLLGRRKRTGRRKRKKFEEAVAKESVKEKEEKESIH